VTSKQSRWGDALRVALATLIVLVAAVFVVPMVCAPPAPAQRWTFTEPVTHVRDLGFSVPLGQSGSWSVVPHEDATGATALANLAGNPGAPPAAALAPEMHARDLRAFTRCKSDDRCGLVFRYQSLNNHYLARVDASRRTVALAVVLAGSERTIAEAPLHTTDALWHDLELDVRADRFVISYGGKVVIDVKDISISTAGKIGLWAPSEAVAYFDELSIQPLKASVHPLELLPVMNRG
jgi:hypothetical protein